jgi:hypothetical protein
MTEASALITRCNSVGDNPNTTDYVQKLCNSWLDAKDFGYSDKIATYKYAVAKK